MKRMLVVSDPHGGALSGLTHPDYHRKDYLAVQEPFWAWWWEKTKDLPRYDVLLILGDATEGPGKKGTLGLLTTDPDEQAEIGAAAFRHIRARHKIAVFGTPFHTAGESSYEKLFASILGADIRTEQRFILDGVRFQARHDVGTSTIPYGQGTPTLKEAVRDALQSIIEDYQIADVYLRGHTHYHMFIGNCLAMAMTIPCLKIPLADYEPFGRKMKPQYYDVGFTEFEIRGGRYSWDTRRMPLKIATPTLGEYRCLD